MKPNFIFLLFILSTGIKPLCAQDSLLVLSTSMFDSDQIISISRMDHWIFKKGHNPRWSDPDLDVSDWEISKPTEVESEMADENGRLEGWFRLRFKLDSSFAGMEVGMIQKSWAATDIYLNGDSLFSFGNTGINGEPYYEYERVLTHDHKVEIVPEKEYVLAIHLVDHISPLTKRLKFHTLIFRIFFI